MRADFSSLLTRCFCVWDLQDYFHRLEVVLLLCSLSFFPSILWSFLIIINNVCTLSLLLGGTFGACLSGQGLPEGNGNGELVVHHLVRLRPLHEVTDGRVGGVMELFLHHTFREQVDDNLLAGVTVEVLRGSLLLVNTRKGLADTPPKVHQLVQGCLDVCSMGSRDREFRSLLQQGLDGEGGNLRVHYHQQLFHILRDVGEGNVDWI